MEPNLHTSPILATLPYYISEKPGQNPENTHTFSTYVQLYSGGNIIESDYEGDIPAPCQDDEKDNRIKLLL